MSTVRGATGGTFGIFGKIFRRRLAAPKPIGTGGLLDGLDDDAAADQLAIELERDNAAYLRALKGLELKAHPRKLRDEGPKGGAMKVKSHA